MTVITHKKTSEEEISKNNSVLTSHGLKTGFVSPGAIFSITAGLKLQTL